jgi:hypothetical protein
VTFTHDTASAAARGDRACRQADYPMTAAAGRRLLAEFTSTGPLVAVVVGSGIAVTRLTGDAVLRLPASAA